MVQQVEAAVVPLREVDVGHHDQDLNDVAEVFGDGVMEWRVPVRVLKWGGGFGVAVKQKLQYRKSWHNFFS